MHTLSRLIRRLSAWLTERSGVADALPADIRFAAPSPALARLNRRFRPRSAVRRDRGQKRRSKMLRLSSLVARLRARARRPAAAELLSNRDWADLPTYHPRQD